MEEIMIISLLKISSMTLVSMITASSAFAASCLAIDAKFTEGAPRDNFVILNKSPDNIDIKSAELSLKGSKGKLIFDTIDGGRGVEVFQQFRSEESSAMLATKPKLEDGADVLSLKFEHFSPKETYRFSLDVDDQLTNSELGQIRVSSSEMNGAKIDFVVVDGEGKKHKVTATFGNDNTASLKSVCI